MDRDRELARLVREAGLVPVERVRESLRRVGMLRSKGRETDLLRELVRQGHLDDAGAQRIEQMWRAEQERTESVKLVRLRASERDRARSPGSDGTLPQAGGVRLSEAERSLLQEQARIVDLAKLISRDDLRAAYLEVAQQRLKGAELDLLDYLEQHGHISAVHARAVRAKMHLDRQQPPGRSKPAPGARSATGKPSAGTGNRSAAPPGVPPEHDPPQQQRHRRQKSPPPPQPAQHNERKGNAPRKGEGAKVVELPQHPGAAERKAAATEHEETNFPDLSVVGFDGTPTGASPTAASSRSATGAGSPSQAATGGGGVRKAPASPAEALRQRDRELARILLEERERITQPQLSSLQRRMDAARRRGRRSDLAQELLNAGLVSWEELAPLLESLPRVPGDWSKEERLAEAQAAQERSAAGDGPGPSSASQWVKPLGGGPVGASRSGSGSARVRRVPAGESGEAHELPQVELPPRAGKPNSSTQSVDGEGGQPAPEPPATADSTGAALPPERLVTYIPQVNLPRSLPTGAGRKRRSKKEKRTRQSTAPRQVSADSRNPSRFHPPASTSASPSAETGADQEVEPLGALEGDVGEDRLSVRRALGLGSGVHLRDEYDEDEPSVEEWGESEIGAASEPGVAAPGPLASRRSKYKLLGKIASGGMGSVVRVEDRDIRRVVAMKRLENRREREAMERFIEEAQVTGQLEHPNIVPVHDVGLDPQGRLFFTMKFVHGESLAEILAQIRRRNNALSKDSQRRGTTRNRPKASREVSYRGFNLARLLQVFLKVCDAIGFAHAKGVIHRDLKPENVMIGAFGEVLVMDWGVAKLIEPKPPAEEAGADSRERVKRRRTSASLPRMGGLVQTASSDVARQVPGGSDRVSSSRAEQSSLQSQTGDIVGTAMYMSPEQARGEVGSLDERTDVYALGAMLYEILTLKPPYDGQNVFLILRSVLDEELVPPRTQAPERNIPPQLESIVLRAMQKNRADRYPSVEALKAEVLEFVEQRMIEEPHYSGVAPQRGRRPLRRSRLFNGIVAATLLLAVAGSWLAWGGSDGLFDTGDRSEEAERQAAHLEKLRESLSEAQTRLRTAEAAALHANVQEQRLREAWRDQLRALHEEQIADYRLAEAGQTLARWQRLADTEPQPAWLVAQANLERLREQGPAEPWFTAPPLPATHGSPLVALRGRDITAGPVLLVCAHGRDLVAYGPSGERLTRLERFPKPLARLQRCLNVPGRIVAVDQRGRLYRLDLSPVLDALATRS